MTRWWVSWYEPAKPDETGEGEGEYVEIVLGGESGIERAWCTGFDVVGYELKRAIVCAVVDADSIASVMRIVAKSYSPRLYRFVEPKPDGWLPPHLPPAGQP